MARTLKSDKVLFWATLALVCTSVVMVYSATAVSGAGRGPKQLAFAALGVLALFVAMRVDYHHLRRPAVIWTLLGFTAASLIAVFFFESRQGATRWIPLGSVATFQPSELAKLAAIVFAAAVLERRMHRIKEPAYALGPIAMIVGVLALLIVKEPDLGTAAVLILAVLAMIIAAGLSWRYLTGVCLLMLPVLVYFVLAFPFRVRRLLAFWNPAGTERDVGYQLEQSKIALGSGGPFGLGLSEGVQKLYFLPEPSNDFILAVIGEELGLIGTTAVLICFAVVVWRGLRAALLAPDRFGALLGIGIAMMVGIQAFINISVVVGLAPTKGIPLPLVSYGGSSLVITLIAMGILLNISQQASPTAAATVGTT